MNTPVRLRLAAAVAVAAAAVTLLLGGPTFADNAEKVDSSACASCHETGKLDTQDRRRRLPLDPRGAGVPRLPRRQGHRPARGGGEAVLRRLRGLQDVPRAGVGRLPGARPRRARHLRRHAALLRAATAATTSCRRSVQRSQHPPVQPAGDLRHLPREPRPHLEVRHPASTPRSQIYNSSRARPRHHGRRLRGRHLQRLPLDRRHRPQDPRSRRPHSTINHFNIPTTCGKCHKGIESDYWEGIHGQLAARRRDRRADLHHCHGEHGILSPSTTRARRCRGPGRRGDLLAVPRVGRAEREVRPADRPPATFVDSYHGLKSKAGDTHVANCASCHGVHRILPARDPTSTVNPTNLQKTCGECHPSITAEHRGDADPRRHRRRACAPAPPTSSRRSTSSPSC